MEPHPQLHILKVIAKPCLDLGIAESRTEAGQTSVGHVVVANKEMANMTNTTETVLSARTVENFGTTSLNAEQE